VAEKEMAQGAGMWAVWYFLFCFITDETSPEKFSYLLKLPLLIRGENRSLILIFTGSFLSLLPSSKSPRLVPHHTPLGSSA
jgi:hypothetical protein